MLNSTLSSIGQSTGDAASPSQEAGAETANPSCVSSNRKEGDANASAQARY